MEFLLALFKILIFPGFLLLIMLGLAFHWLDRKLIAQFEGRVGPPWFQPIADLIKLLAKEDILPNGTNPMVAALLPLLSFACVLTAGFYIPIAVESTASFSGDLIAVLFLLSLPSLLYFLVGWTTSGVYSVLGGNRSLLQYFSYEVLFLMAISGTAIASGSWSIAGIRAAQENGLPYVLPQMIGFGLSIAGLIGKLKRSPYDIPKAKSEMIRGPLTDISGRKLVMWQLTTQIQTIAGLSLLIHCFFGGLWQMNTVSGFFIFFALLLGLQFVLSVISAVFARLRIDQLVRLNWHLLIPISIVHTIYLIL